MEPNRRLLLSTPLGFSVSAILIYAINFKIKSGQDYIKQQLPHARIYVWYAMLFWLCVFFFYFQANANTCMLRNGWLCSRCFRIICNAIIEIWHHQGLWDTKRDSLGNISSTDNSMPTGKVIIMNRTRPLSRDIAVTFHGLWYQREVNWGLDCRFKTPA